MPVADADPAVPDPPADTLSPATAAALEVASFLQLLAGHAGTDLGRERIRALAPAANVEELVRRRGLFEEAVRLLIDARLVPSREEPLAPLLDQLGRGGQDLRGRDLVEVAGLLEASRRAAGRIAAADPPCPGLAALTTALPAADALRRALSQTLDARGEVREDATPELAALRGRIRRQRNRIYEDLTSFVDQNRELLSEDTIPLRGGRLVLMLQAGARGRAPGLVHGTSASGRSFYFEPLATVDLNNDLQQAVEEEEAERRRILAELVARLRRELATVAAHARFVAELDLLQAAATFAREAGARLAELGPRQELRLVAARHPLLDPDLAELRARTLGTPGHRGRVVPLDVAFDPDHRVLVVTGPNAGGKTVALKTLGLLALVHLCGLPVPAAAGTRLPFLRRVVATVGDDQDLLTDRSTFSGRLLRLREAWDGAGAEALILLDELGSGTDPEEGAALAVALLEGLLERRSLTLVTTHLTQLAAAALERPGASCAAMEFDAATGEPTYLLLPGPPGGSEALALARRLGLPGRWLDRAEELLGSEHRELRRLLAEVEKARRELTATRERAAAELADAERLRRRLAEEERGVAEERRRLAGQARKELEEFRREVRQRLGEEVERLRGEVAAGRRRGLAAAAAERLFEEAPRIAPAEPPAAGPLRPGDPVIHRALGWQGVLETLDRDRARVRVRGKTVRCRADELAPASDGARRVEQPASARRRPTRPAAVDPELATDVAGELNLIGQRVEPALETLDRYLDRVLLASLSQVRIIHGHGSGRLRSAVRDHLRRHPAVASQRPGGDHEGGDGATVAQLVGGEGRGR